MGEGVELEVQGLLVEVLGLIECILDGLFMLLDVAELSKEVVNDVGEVR